jgi:hypothetical protein
VGYLRMFYFSSETTRAMVQALSSWEEAGLQGYIIDLRNNPGSHYQVGYLLTTIRVTGGARMGRPLLPECSIQPLSRPAPSSKHAAASSHLPCLQLPADMLQHPATCQACTFHPAASSFRPPAASSQPTAHSHRGQPFGSKHLKSAHLTTV